MYIRAEAGARLETHGSSLSTRECLDFSRLSGDILSWLVNNKEAAARTSQVSHAFRGEEELHACRSMLGKCG